MVGYRHFSRIEKLYLLIEKRHTHLRQLPLKLGNSLKTISIHSLTVSIRKLCHGIARRLRKITEFVYFSSTGITIHLIEWMIFFTRLGLLIEACSIEDLYFVSLVFVGYMYTNIYAFIQYV